MEINYQETSKDLLVRIDIHAKYGSANIDQWTVDLLKPQPGYKILDVGCGSGKQCFLYNDLRQGAGKDHRRRFLRGTAGQGS
jgi:ubiquinone/menaquinone biosynthesis C-methylase UbiE